MSIKVLKKLIINKKDQRNKKLNNNKNKIIKMIMNKISRNKKMKMHNKTMKKKFKINKKIKLLIKIQNIQKNNKIKIIKRKQIFRNKSK